MSQRFHRFWRARVLGDQGWSEAKTAAVNGVFQGVVLPEGTRKVELRFEPFSRFAWMAHAFWLVIATALAGRWLWGRARSSGVSSRRSFGAPTGDGSPS